MHFISKAFHRATDPARPVRQIWRRPLLSACALLALTLPSYASTLAPDPIIYGAVGGIVVSEVGSYSDGGATLSISGLPGVTVSTQAIGPGSHGAGHSFASGTFGYDIYITGGSLGDVVPLLISGSLSTDSLGAEDYDVTNAVASLILNFANGTSAARADVFCGNVLRGEDCSNPSWSGTLSAVGWVGYDNFVTVFASSEVAGAGFANAFADPHVYIDPAFHALHPEYGLDISPLVGNESVGAPEPATWFLTGGALVLAGLMRRRGQATGRRKR